jgi:hypothetical protein
MSQHSIVLLSPVLGEVEVIAGFDAALGEAFVTWEFEDRGFLSPSGITIADISRLVQDKLGVSLPQQVVQGIGADLADLRIGASDLGKRVYRYNSDGTRI